MCKGLRGLGGLRSRAEGTGACGGRRHSFLHPGVRSGLWEAARLS